MIAGRHAPWRGALRAAGLALALGACAQAPQNPQPPTFDVLPERTPDGLERFESPVFEVVYVKPGLRLGDYDKIQIRPIRIGYKAEPGRVRLFDAGDGNFRLTDEQRFAVSAAFSRAFARAMTEDQRFTLVTSPLPGALQFNIALAQLEVNIPPAEDGGNDRIMVDKVGEMTLVIDVQDAATGEPLVRGRDTYVVQSGEGATREELALEIEDLFGRWCRDLRRGVDRLSE